jgi:Ice-binding-like/Bacterial Ig-like domain
MKTIKASALLFLLSLALACGQQLVQFPDSDAARETQAVDAGEDDADAEAANADAESALGPDGSDAAAINNPNADAATPDAESTGSPDGSDAAAINSANPDAAGPDAESTGSPDGSDAAAINSANPDAASADAESDVADAGNPDASESDAANTTPPVVISTNPANGTAGVSIAKILTATFSQPMDPTTINAATFTLEQGTTPVLGVVSVLGAIATFVPTSDLALNTTYTAAITTGAKDLAGNAIASPYTWTFTTSACGQAPVALASAASFVVLAGSTVTSTGPTSIIGDLGVSPGTAITGFPPGTVVGAEHAGDPTAAQGVADLTTAYNNTANRTLCAITVAGNLGGQTLTPGLYKSTSSLAISAGDLTLDAQGDPDAVFIFQMASTLTTTPGRQVILSGAAKSTNVFWQVGTSATLGTTTAFQGTIMANQAITLDTGATLNGRALAMIAAVALESNTIVMPAP